MQDNKLKLQPAPFWSIIGQLLFFNCLLSVCLKKPNTNKSFNQSIGHSFKHREMVFLIGEPYKKCSNGLSTKQPNTHLQRAILYHDLLQTNYRKKTFSHCGTFQEGLLQGQQCFDGVLQFVTIFLRVALQLTLVFTIYMQSVLFVWFFFLDKIGYESCTEALLNSTLTTGAEANTTDFL